MLWLLAAGGERDEGQNAREREKFNQNGEQHDPRRHAQEQEDFTRLSSLKLFDTTHFLRLLRPKISILNRPKS